MNTKSHIVAFVLYGLFGVVALFMPAKANCAQSVENQTRSGAEIATQNPSTSLWGPPYPFTPDELQQKLIAVLKIPGNDLSEEIVEKMFGMTFQKARTLSPESAPIKITQHEKFYFVYNRAVTDWYFALSMSVRPKLSTFYFTWWSSDNTPEPYIVPMCLDTSSLLKDIRDLNLGWVEELFDPLMMYPHGRPPTHYFHRDNGDLLRVDFVTGTNCMTAFDLTLKTIRGN